MPFTDEKENIRIRFIISLFANYDVFMNIVLCLGLFAWESCFSILTLLFVRVCCAENAGFIYVRKYVFAFVDEKARRRNNDMSTNTVGESTWNGNPTVGWRWNSSSLFAYASFSSPTFFCTDICTVIVVYDFSPQIMIAAAVAFTFQLFVQLQLKSYDLLRVTEPIFICLVNKLLYYWIQLYMLNFHLAFFIFKWITICIYLSILTVM